MVYHSIHHIFGSSESTLIMKKLLLLITICISTISFGQYTSIPDPNFEQALIDLGHDDVIDGQVLTSNISGVTYLNVSNKNISDLAGIEEFVGLVNLDASYNSLNHIELSTLQNLEVLNLYSNNLDSLSIDSLKESLIFLDVSNNNLSTFEWIDNGVWTQGISLYPLNTLLLGSNQLTSLIIEGTEISTLNIAHNLLSDVDFSTNYYLTTVYCQNNLFSTLNFNQCLHHLETSGNSLLTCLTISASCSPFLDDPETILSECPNLTCIEVDDPIWCNNNLLQVIDPWASFSEDCGDCSGTSNLTELNPNQPKELIKIVNLLGQEVEYIPNTVLIYQYSDGTSEKVFTIED